jgi:hypothetical protein
LLLFRLIRERATATTTKKMGDCCWQPESSTAVALFFNYRFLSITAAHFVFVGGIVCFSSNDWWLFFFFFAGSPERTTLLLGRDGCSWHWHNNIYKHTNRAIIWQKIELGAPINFNAITILQQTEVIR